MHIKKILRILLWRFYVECSLILLQVDIAYHLAKCSISASTICQEMKEDEEKEEHFSNHHTSYIFFFFFFSFLAKKSPF